MREIRVKVREFEDGSVQVKNQGRAVSVDCGHGAKLTLGCKPDEFWIDPEVVKMLLEKPHAE